MNSTLQRTERDGILLLTLNRPEARNAMDFELATALAAAMDELDAREDLRLGIITGAQRAHAYGLVNRLTEPGQALAVAQELGSAIAANGPLAIATSKQVIVESADWPTRDMFELQRALIGPVFSSADAREGAAAFAEKRKPAWTGK